MARDNMAPNDADVKEREAAANEARETALAREKAADPNETAQSETPFASMTSPREIIAERERSEGRAASDPADEEALLPRTALSDYQSRWQDIQVGFVDEPRAAVRDAEKLVNDMVAQLTTIFTQERANLEESWSSSEESDASTEDLRVALQRYRTFFQRLLAA